MPTTGNTDTPATRHSALRATDARLQRRILRGPPRRRRRRRYSGRARWRIRMSSASVRRSCGDFGGSGRNNTTLTRIVDASSVVVVVVVAAVVAAALPGVKVCATRSPYPPFPDRPSLRRSLAGSPDRPPAHPPTHRAAHFTEHNTAAAAAAA